MNQHQRKHMILGGIFLLLGISIILKAVFKIDIPVFRVFVACLFIYWGFRMLFGDCGSHRVVQYSDEKTAVFANLSAKHLKGDRGEYNVVFGDGKIDLSETSSSQAIEINSVFGDIDVVLDPQKIYALNANAVFGKIRLPDGEKLSFGSLRTRIPDKAGEAQAHIEANSVFGEIRFLLKATEKTETK